MSLAAKKKKNELANVGNYLLSDSPKQNAPHLVLIAQENVGFIAKYLKSWFNVYLPFLV